jgi:hypothetical protein
MVPPKRAGGPTGSRPCRTARLPGMDELVFSVSTSGDQVAECELAPEDAGLLAGLTEEARRAGAALLWVHCPRDLSGFGLSPREGYRRFTAGDCPVGEPLPLLDVETIAGLWPLAFRGQWGHKWVDADLARSLASSGELLFIGLREGEQWTGLCAFDPANRAIDGPGFTGRPRTTEAVQRFVRGAGAHLGAGPVTVETWGEPAGPYLALGLELAEDGGGWELVLGPTGQG